MKKIDYKTAYETLYMAYEMLLDEVTKLKNNKMSINEMRILHGLPPIETAIIKGRPKDKVKRLDHLNMDYYYEKDNYESLSKEEIGLDIITLRNWLNKIIDYIGDDSNE